jgi:phytoene desaturase
MKKKIVVIGGGFGGLAAANRLAAKGHDVTLIDKRDKPGGRGYQYEINGFKFDGGPTVLTAPYIFEEIFQAAGKKSEDYFELLPLDPFYRLFDDKGNSFDYCHGYEDMLSEIEKWKAGDVKGYEKFVGESRKIFNLFHPYTDQPFLEFRKMLKIMPGVMKLHGYLSTHLFVSRFIKNDHLRRFFSFHPLLVGGSPFETPALYTLIVQFEKEWGVHYARGGTGAVVSGLGRLFTDLGGETRLNTEVREILVKDRKVTGVLLEDGSEVNADIIVCNGDVAYSYRNLIDSVHRRKYTDRRIDRMKYSMSLVVIYFGTKRRYLDSGLAHHNIIFSRRYKGLLKDIVHGDKLPEDFSLYLHMPTITDPSIAPEGCESFYVLSLVPTLRANINWQDEIEPYKQKIYQYLEAHYLPDLRSNIIAEHHIDPVHFRDTLNSHLGAAFSLRPSLLQSGYFRPHNRSEEFDNLYFVGAGTHPGAGVPAVLSSGKIAAELIDPSPKK